MKSLHHQVFIFRDLEGIGGLTFIQMGKELVDHHAYGLGLLVVAPGLLHRFFSLPLHRFQVCEHKLCIYNFDIPNGIH